MESMLGSPVQGNCQCGKGKQKNMETFVSGLGINMEKEVETVIQGLGYRAM